MRDIIQLHSLFPEQQNDSALGRNRSQEENVGGRVLERYGKYDIGRETVFNLIPRAPFRLLCREIVQDTQIKVPSKTKRIPLSSMRVYNISEAATDALQEASEAYLVGLLDDSNLLAIHARRQTLLRKDMELAKRIRGDDHRFRPLQ